MSACPGDPSLGGVPEAGSQAMGSSRHNALPPLPTLIASRLPPRLASSHTHWPSSCESTARTATWSVCVLLVFTETATSLLCHLLGEAKLAPQISTVFIRVLIKSHRCCAVCPNPTLFFL